jgi:hypothetical protein
VGTLTHDPGVGGEGRLFCELGRGPIEAGLRVGFRLRRETTLYDVRLGSAIGFAIGLGVRLAARTAAFAEVAGSTAARRPFGRSTESPVEALVGVRQRFGRAWLTLAAGPGLSDGFGSPVFRGVLGLDWASRPPDSDDARPPPAATGSEIARP